MYGPKKLNQDRENGNLSLVLVMGCTWLLLIIMEQIGKVITIWLFIFEIIFIFSKAGGYIYTSSDFGSTWLEQTSAGAQYWFDIASSNNGSKLVAIVEEGINACIFLNVVKKSKFKFKYLLLRLHLQVW